MAVRSLRPLIALRAPKNRVRSRTLPAPVGGWNTRDGLPLMPEEDAVILDNFFPNSTSVDLRKGYAPQTASVSGYIETLMAYSSPTTDKLFAASSIGTVYDVTTADSFLTDESGNFLVTEDGNNLIIEGVGSSATLTGMSNGRFQYVNFATSGGNFIVICNGTDSVRNYNGTTWSTPTITGVTSANLVHVNAHKNRLWFVEEDALSAWYLPTQSVAGAASELDLSAFCTKGGYLQAMATWTVDAGYGVDDHAAFITSKGQVLIYRGTDPASSATWALVGIWDIGAPVGRRCFLKWAGDLLIITQDGVVPMSVALQSARTNLRIDITDKIETTMADSATDFSDNFGWQLIFYPRGGQLYLNVPLVERITHHQYVMNTRTKAWCRFKGWNAGCWEIYQDELYFGAYQLIAKAWSGTNDAGGAIEAAAIQAFSELGQPGVQKQAKIFQTLFYTTGSPDLTGGVNVDYDTSENTASLQVQTSLYGLWDTGTWDSAIWGPDLEIRKSWNGVAGVGNAFAPTLNADTVDVQVQWVNSTIVFEEGGFV